MWLFDNLPLESCNAAGSAHASDAKAPRLSHKHNLQALRTSRPDVIIPCPGNRNSASPTSAGQARLPAAILACSVEQLCCDPIC